MKQLSTSWKETRTYHLAPAPMQLETWTWQLSLSELHKTEKKLVTGLSITCLLTNLC